MSQRLVVSPLAKGSLARETLAERILAGQFFDGFAMSTPPQAAGRVFKRDID